MDMFFGVWGIVLLALIFAVVVLYVKIKSESTITRIAQTPAPDRFRPPPPPSINTNRIPQRRRKRGGGFYPVGYTGSYYDDEDLVDEILYAVEISAFDVLTNGGYEIPAHEEPMFENDEDDIRNNFGGFSDSSDDNWGSDDDNGDDD